MLVVGGFLFFIGGGGGYVAEIQMIEYLLLLQSNKCIKTLLKSKQKRFLNFKVRGSMEVN